MEDRGTVNAFANDGSFMEIFRKKMEEERLRSSSTNEGRSSSGGGHGGAEAEPCQLAGESFSLPDRSAGPAGSIKKEMLPESATSRHESATQRSNDADVHDLSLPREIASSQQRTRPTEKSKSNNESKTEDSVTSDAVAARKFTQEQSPGETLKTASSATKSVSAQKKYSLLSHVGKRRDGKMSLKTGAVKKQRIANTQETQSQDSWSKYMAEVQKYKAHVCGDEDKSRPLVK